MLRRAVKTQNRALQKHKRAVAKYNRGDNVVQGIMGVQREINRYSHEGREKVRTALEQNHLESELGGILRHWDAAEQYVQDHAATLATNPRIAAIDEGLHAAVSNYSKILDSGVWNDGGLHLGLNKQTLNAGAGLVGLVSNIYDIGKNAYQGIKSWWAGLTGSAGGSDAAPSTEASTNPNA